jgi:hypothetical protein
MNVRLENDNEHELKKANTVYGMAQKICPIRQSWGEAVPINVELNFKCYKPLRGLLTRPSIFIKKLKLGHAYFLKK